jgi:DNA primase
VRIDKAILNEINENTDILNLVSPYVKLQKKGKNYVGLCPFHDDTNPSFSVSTEKNIAKCFSCGEGGSPITFLAKIKNISFDQAALELAEPLGIKLDIDRVEKQQTLKEHEALNEANIFYTFYLKNSKTGEEALNYLKNRGLTLEDIAHFNIGLAPKEFDSLYKLLQQKEFTDQTMENAGLIGIQNNKPYDLFTYRVMFPLSDLEGRVIGFSGRSVDNKEPKYYNSPETFIFKKSEVLYHLYEALGDIRKQGFVILHEGFFDVIASTKAGLKNAVATMGTALTQHHIKLISEYTKRVVIAYDGDQAGIMATYKAIKLFERTNLRVDILALPEGLDPDEYYQKYGAVKYLNLYKKHLVDPYEFIYETTKKELNLSNLNDAAALKDATYHMVKNQPVTIKEIYLNKLAKDLNVSTYSLSYFLTNETKTIKVQPKPMVQFPNKYYKAENQLFIQMMRNKEDAIRIDQALSGKFVCDMVTFKLRNILTIKYYKSKDEFDKDAFIKLLSKEKDSEALTIKFFEIYYSNDNRSEFKYPEATINELLGVVINVNMEKEFKANLEELKNENESYQKTAIAEVIKKQIVKRQTNKKKGESS